VSAAIVAGLATALVCQLLIRRLVYNLFDPLLVVNISLPFSAALLAFLCDAELIAWDRFWYFAAILLAYLFGGRVIGAFFGRDDFREAVDEALADMRPNEINVILTLTVGLTLVLAVLGLQAGAGGDARQDFARVFRPMLLFQNGLLLFALVLLLSSQVSRMALLGWLTALVVLSIPFSGKSVLFPVLYWFGVRLYLQRRSITLATGASMVLLVLSGVAFMGLLSYGASSASGAFLLITNRFWMSGDVYIFAYQSNGLDAVRGNYPVSFFAYMMHPITALVGIRAYDKPLGSMLASEVMRDDVLTGPNPQLPVVLDYFFPDQLAAGLCLAFVIGLLVIGVRPLGLTLACRTSPRFLRLGGIVAAIFAPSAGFLDTSQVMISLVGIAGACGFLVALDLLMTRSRPVGYVHSGS
jgi:hypothetical protein